MICVLYYLTMESDIIAGLLSKEKSLQRTEEQRQGIPLSEILTWEDYFQKYSIKLRQKRGKLKEYEQSGTMQNYAINSELNKSVSLYKGDITMLRLDAVVNAANNSLLGGGGVDGAIHSKAGPNLLLECKSLRGCDTGEAKITGAYDMPAKYIIHTVGPIGEKPDLLESSYKSCLNVATKNQLKTIAFPCISTGVYGYPQTKAAIVALREVRAFLEANPNKLDRVVFCLFLPDDVMIYETLMQQFFPVE